MGRMYTCVLVGVLGMFAMLHNTQGQATNIAIGKDASQFSAFEDATNGFTWFANKSIDGRFNETQFCSASLVPGGSNATNFWQVDLGSEFSMGSLVIYGRPDANAEIQLSGFEVHVTTMNGSTQLVYTDNTSLPYPVDSRFEIMFDTEVMGQIVRIERPGGNEVIALCEVEIYEADSHSNDTTDAPTSGPTIGPDGSTNDPSMSPGTGNGTMMPPTTTTTMSPTMDPGSSTTESSNGANRGMPSLTFLVLSLLLVYVLYR